MRTKNCKLCGQAFYGPEDIIAARDKCAACVAGTEFWSGDVGVGTTKKMPDLVCDVCRVPFGPHGKRGFVAGRFVCLDCGTGLEIERRKNAAQQKVEGGWKQDGGKARMDLIAPEFLTATADILTFGADKYAERNWEKGMSWGRCFGALMRHLWAWWAGDEKDAETGRSHLHHAACCLMFLIAYEARKIGTDDRKIEVDGP